MKKKTGIKMMVTAMLSVVLLFIVSCKKKEAPAVPKGLKAEVFEDHIRLSWNRVFNADYYSISVDFYGRDSYNCISDETYNVLLDETSNTYYKDIYPFEGMNYYKVKAVNEYGSSSYSEISCSYLTNGQVALYPNPTSGNVTIEVAGMSRITVMGVLDQVVFDTEFNADNYTLNMAQWDTGIYVVRIVTENGEVVKRIVFTND